MEKREGIKRKKAKKRKKKALSDQEIAILSKRLLASLEKSKKEDLIDKSKKVLEYPGVKEVLALLATGSFLVLAAVAPGVVYIGKSILDEKSDKKWKKYNQWYLQRTLKRLKKSKMIDFDVEEDKMIVKLNNRGRKKILRYSLEEMEIKRPKRWDRK